MIRVSKIDFNQSTVNSHCVPENKNVDEQLKATQKSFAGTTVHGISSSLMGRSVCKNKVHKDGQNFMTLQKRREITQKKILEAKSNNVKNRIFNNQTPIENKKRTTQIDINNEEIKRSNKIMAKKISMIKSTIPHFR